MRLRIPSAAFSAVLDSRLVFASDGRQNEVELERFEGVLPHTSPRRMLFVFTSRVDFS